MTTAPPLTGAVPARLALDLALAAHRGPLPCRADPDAWHAAAAAEREQAAAACAPCPLRSPCLAAAVAARETFGTWGGVDMQDPAARRTARQAAQPTTEETP